MSFPHVPHWLLRFIQEKRCIKCEQGICDKDVVAIGIRVVEDGGTLPYFEYICPTCQHRSVAVVENDPQHKYSLIDLAYGILQERKNRRDLDKARLLENLPGDKMRDEEVKEFIEFVRNVENHEEFMKQIGDYPLDDEKENNHKQPEELGDDGLYSGSEPDN